MADTKVEMDYRVRLPDEVHPFVSVGQHFVVSLSEEGALVLTPVTLTRSPAEIDEILNRTAGLWQGRADIPADGFDITQ
jgi:hypothetical protein